ncbi:ferrous iron transport protein B, partial [Staphylococcus capitis]
VFPIVARKGKGTEELLNELSFLHPKERRNFKISYGKETEDAIKQMTSIIQAHTEYPSKRLRFIAIQYLLDNPEIERELPSVISEQIEPIKEKLSQHLDV